MKGTGVVFIFAALVVATLGCGNTESNEPQAPTGGGTGGAGGNGAAGGGVGGGAVRKCQPSAGDNPYNPPSERLQFTGSNGTFEDHCDNAGHLVQYGCATVVPCTPTPQTPCVPDATVPYETGAVSESTLDCACIDGACPPP